MTYTFSNELISDLHKDAYGFRPSQRFFDDWETYTDDEKQECWDFLCDTMEAAEKQRIEMEAAALVAFRKVVRETMNVARCKWYEAVRYLCDAEGDNIQCEQGFDYFLWKNDLGYEDRAKIRKLYEEAA